MEALQKYETIDMRTVNVVGVDLPKIGFYRKRFAGTTTAFCSWVPEKYSTNTRIPTVGHLFLGAVYRPNIALNPSTVRYYLDDKLLVTELSGGYLRPSKLPVPLGGVKGVLTVRCIDPTSHLELVFLDVPEDLTGITF